MDNFTLKQIFFDLADEMEKNCKNWKDQVISEKDCLVTEKILNMIFQKEKKNIISIIKDNLSKE